MLKVHLHWSIQSIQAQTHCLFCWIWTPLQENEGPENFMILFSVKGTKTACFGIKVIYNIYKDHLRALHY